MKPPSILIVDDDSRWREVLKNLLAGSGYEVSEAEGEEEALQLIAAQYFDLLLLDYKLGGSGNALGIIKRASEMGLKMGAVIIVTGYPDITIALAAARLGVVEFFNKQDLKDFRARTQQVLEESQGLVDPDAKPVRIFISYTSSDSHVAIGIYHRLKDNGYSPWIDQRDLIAGRNFEREIQKAIKESDFFISCVSVVAVERPFFELETQLAVARHDEIGEPFVLPIRVDESELPAQFVARKLQSLKYSTRDDDWWHRLVRALKTKRVS